jgi:hypothetical protein
VARIGLEVRYQKREREREVEARRILQWFSTLDTDSKRAKAEAEATIRDMGAALREERDKCERLRKQLTEAAALRPS